jgi:hypothetical protein
MKTRVQRQIVSFSSLALLMIASVLPSHAAPSKDQIDNYARANGFPRSDYPYYENVNQCGGEGATSRVPDKYELKVRNPFTGKMHVVFRADFREACDNHDRCYMTAGSNRRECDAKFERDLKNRCGSIVSNPGCHAFAKTYSEVVYNVGGEFFPGAQAQARRYNSLVSNIQRTGERFPSCGSNIEIRPTNQNLNFSRGTSWETCTGYLFIFQDDGNLVLYNRTRQPLWASNTRSSNPPNLLAIQTDGNMVLYRNRSPVWAVNPGIRSGSF